MDNIFVLRSDVTPLDLQSAIEERLSKVQAITFVLTCTENSTAASFYDQTSVVAWALNDYIMEINELFNEYSKLKKDSEWEGH